MAPAPTPATSAAADAECGIVCGPVQEGLSYQFYKHHTDSNSLAVMPVV